MTHLPRADVKVGFACNNRFVDLDGQIADYSAWRESEGKSHGPPCEGCAMRPRCEGPWREYPAKFGWDEFEPITSIPEGSPPPAPA